MTGYPPTSRPRPLDPEADLGVDTVKQAEVFAAVRAAWDVATRTLQTAGPPDDETMSPPGAPAQTGCLARRRPLAAPVSAAAAARRPPGSGGGGPCHRRCSGPSPAIVADDDRLSADLLDPDLDLEADLGVDTVKQAEVFAGPWRLGPSNATRTSNCATSRR